MECPRAAARPAPYAPDNFGEREIGVIQGVARVDDALLGRIVECLRLLDVAARADTRLLARLGLVEQGAKGFALGAIGCQLIRGRQNREICLGDAKHQALLCSPEGGLGRRRLKICLFELAECLENSTESETC